MMTMRPLVVSMTIALALSRLAGSGCAIAGAAQISAAMTAYFAFANSQGGVNGRKITLKVLDDGYNPAITATDSCAIEGHPMIDRLWTARLALVDCVIALRPGQARALRVWLAGETARRRLREAAGQLTLHGAHFDVRTGLLAVLGDDGRFATVG